jgi:WD40 repeat protein
MKKASSIGALLALILCLWNCSKARTAVPSLIDGDKPLHVYGSEQSGRYYKSMTHYILGKSGRVYLWDVVTFDHVDAYDEEGSFLFQFGRFGQGPGELQGVICGAVDSKGDIWLADDRKSLKIFSANGEFKQDWPLPPDVAKSYIGKAAFDDDDDLYIMNMGNEGQAYIFRCDAKNGQCRLVYSEEKRQRSNFVLFIPDFALDGDGNLYVTDSFDYRLHVFDKEGNPLKQLDVRKGGRKRIVDRDFDIFDIDFKVSRFSDYKNILARLTGPSRFFPEIFGVDIDGGLIYVWTSERDDKARYIVDVYDKDFKRIGQACYFNMVRENAARIMGGKLYIPSIENYDTNLTMKVGPLIYLNFPERLNAYPIAKEIRERR